MAAPRVALMLVAASAVADAAVGDDYLSCADATNASTPWMKCVYPVEPTYGPLPTTSVQFSITDEPLQALFTHGEKCEANSTLTLAPGFDVVVEGGGYRAVWLETQPMGGAMYGVRNLTLALNNQLIFMRTQRVDGRLPGHVLPTENVGVVNPTYSLPHRINISMLQGSYLASPAVDVAWLMNRTISDAARPQQAAAVSAYLDELELVLQRFDSWLWLERNSSNGVLWLATTADTGEDRSDKYSSLPGSNLTAPFESMDMMGYAHDAERALARISAIKGDRAGERYWQAKVNVTAAALKRRLWREELGACYDRERDGNQSYVPTLVHNNLRAMWHGIYSQDMADAFVARHLMNRSEFWTPTPLPSIAANDPRFKDPDEGSNNWSGPPEGLTFQRTIRALEQYGHNAELVLIGTRQKAALYNSMTFPQFPQQIDPFTSIPSTHGDCYGPMLLSMLEYTALTTGIAVRPEASALLWSNVQTDATAAAHTFSFAQQLGASSFNLTGSVGGEFVGSRNGAELFKCSGGTRVVTDADSGAVTRVIGIDSVPVVVRLELPGAVKALVFTVGPNEEWDVAGSKPILVRRVPFVEPF